MKFHFYLDKKENKKKEHQVRITVAMRGVRMVGTIGYNVPMAMWDAKRKHMDEWRLEVKYRVCMCRE